MVMERPSKEDYQDGCAAAHALSLVGERWALLVVRELALGPKRFTDLRVGLPNVSPNVLAQRLRDLEEVGVVQKRKLPPPASVQVYELTEWGYGLEPVLVSLGRWAVHSPRLPKNGTLGVNSLILSFRTMFHPDSAKGLEASYELRLGEETFYAKVANSEFEIARGNATKPDVILETEPMTLTALVYGGYSLSQAVKSAQVKLEGDKKALERFLKLFPLPDSKPYPSLIFDESIVKCNHTRLEGFCLQQFERSFVEGAKNTLPASNRNRKDQETKFINETFFNERLGQFTDAILQDVLSWLLFELGDFFGNVTQ
jgi:DNA-binding HxlR family transcriptional regulator/putative sterol carrier protein